MVSPIFAKMCPKSTKSSRFMGYNDSISLRLTLRFWALTRLAIRW